MYGWINGALEDWVQSTYGIEVWQSIVKISQCDVPAEGFFRNVHYSDEILFQLVRASSIILNLDCAQIIFAVGQQFIHYLERHGYSRTLRCQGSTFLEWLRNVNEPHRLLRSRFPKAMFPVLWAEEDTEYPNKEGPSVNTVIMHYLSKRKDVFVPLFKGILTEAANYYFNIEITMEFLSDEVILSNPEFPEYHARFRLFLGEGASLSTTIAKDISIVEVSEATDQCPFHASRPTPARALSSSVSATLNDDKTCFNSSSNVGSVGVSGSIFQHLFPFHLVLDHSLNIIQMGNKLLELTETKWHIPKVLNHPVNDNFEIITPKFIDWTWSMLQKLDKAPIEIALKTPFQKATNSHEENINDDIYPDTITLRFRGEVILLDGKDADKIVLCVNPDIPHIEYLYQLQMRLADLPCHSYQAEMLLIDEHLKTETNYSLSLKEIGAELDRETKRATKALELKRHFVRYVSHEIRTPLNIAILGLRFMEFALAQQQQSGIKVENASQKTARITNGDEAEEEEEDDESLPVVMNEVKSAVVIAVEILNDLLLYEKVDNSGFFELTQEFYDVHALVHESVSLFKVQAKGADVKFEVDDSLIVRAENDGTLTLPCRLGNDFRHHFQKSPLSLSSALSTSITCQQRQPRPQPTGGSPTDDGKEKDDELESIIVKVDKSKTQQVLRNLFTNAVKFTSPGKSVKISYAVFGTPELLDAFHAEQQQKAVALQLQEEEQQRRLASASHSLEPSPRLTTETSVVPHGPQETDLTQHEGNVDTNVMHPLMANQGLSSKSTRSLASLASRPSVALSSKGGSLKESSSAVNVEDISHMKDLEINKKDLEKQERSNESSPVVVHFAEDFPDFPPYFVRISVKDEGVGISDADQRTLFHEFIQLKAEKLQNGQGSGLGLWIASTIMHLHGGRIGVMSAGEGKGATFFIDLPIVVFEEEEEDEQQDVANDPTHTLPSAMGEGDADVKTETDLIRQIMRRKPLPPVIITSDDIHGENNDHEDNEEALDAFSIHGSDDIFRSSSHASNMSKTSLLPGLTVNTHVFRSPPISPAYRTPNDSFFTGHQDGGGGCGSSHSDNGSVNSSHPTPQNAALSQSHSRSRSRSGSTPPHYYTSQQQLNTSPRWMGNRQPHQPSSASKYMLTMRTPRHLLPVYNNGGYNTRMMYPLDHPALETVRVLIVDDAASNRKMVKRLFQTKFKHLEDAENGKVAVEKYLQSLVSHPKVSLVSSTSQDKSVSDMEERGLSNISATSPHNVADQKDHSKDNALPSENDTHKPPYGLILMDYLMPVMDGIEATRQIKQAAREHNVDVLVFGVTGQGLTEDVQLFKAVGADEVFMKPLDFAKLLACLQTTYHFP